jgi:hypothetical protein
MGDVYDLFEELPNGSKRWLGWAEGIEKALTKLTELGKTTTNEVVAMDLFRRKVAGRVNSKSNGGHNGQAGWQDIT